MTKGHFEMAAVINTFNVIQLIRNNQNLCILIKLVTILSDKVKRCLCSETVKKTIAMNSLKIFGNRTIASDHQASTSEKSICLC